MKPVDRLNFVRCKKLCENCLLGNHTTDVCRKPGRCTVCGAKHTRLIHVIDEGSANCVTANSVANNDSQVNHSSNDIEVMTSNVGIVETQNDISVTHDAKCNVSKQVLLPVVPITVNECFDTFALLDSGSTNSFCSRALVDNVNIKGVKTVFHLSTLENSASERVTEAVSMTVSSGEEMFNMSNVFVMDTIPEPCVDRELFSSYDHLKGIKLPSTGQVDVLIGQDYPDALIPLEVRRGAKGEPYGVRTCLGWSLCGPFKGRNVMDKAFTNYAKLDRQVEQMWRLDNELLSEERAMSIQDQTVVSLWEEKGKLVNGHYELPIPWIRVVNKKKQPNVNNNRCQAVDRFRGLKRRLMKDGDLMKGYVQGIETLLGKGYAEPVPITSLSRDDGRVFYLPHHPVQSPNKDKIRIVFDCSAKYKGASLNDQVFQGPDLVNKLTTVLLRFREHEVAVVGDVEAMYHQVKVPDYDRDMLRFLWPKNNDLEAELLEYRMTVHLFGGAWSSSAANYSLKRTADDNRKNYPIEAVESVISNFYVDDWLVSKPTSAEATNLINNVTDLLKQGGFKLTKFLSTDRDVLKSIPSDRLAKGLADIDLDKHELPQDRALGVKWSTNDDTFYFRPNKLICPSTRRGIISIISSLYDPLGFVSPVVIVGKMIFQELTKLGLTWDESIPEHIEIKWIKWLEELTTLENMKIPRCIRSRVFQDPVRFQVHHFCDASQSAYGVVTYVRMVDSTNQIHVILLLSKARLAPVKVMSIPRLELSAAVLDARIDASPRKELEMHIHESFFWTDSQLVIQYIFNEKKRFHVFVANRIAAIHQACNADQWRYIPSEDNPADYLTRGLSPNDIMSSRWLHGPGFLGKLECELDHFPIEENLPEDDQEIKKNVVTHLVEAQVTYMNDLIVKCSTLHKLKRLVSWILLLKKTLLARCKGVKVERPELTVDLLKEAEIEVIKYVQFTS